jgi:hypothetical protein
MTTALLRREVGLPAKARFLLCALIMPDTLCAFDLYMCWVSLSLSLERLSFSSSKFVSWNANDEKSLARLSLAVDNLLETEMGADASFAALLLASSLASLAAFSLFAKRIWSSRSFCMFILYSLSPSSANAVC